MARKTILVTGDGVPVQGTLGTAQTTPIQLADRVANGEAFPGERMVRLPRRLKVDALSVRAWWEKAVRAA